MAVVFGEREARSARWLGLKPALTKVLLFAPINAAIRPISRYLMPRSIGSRMPLNLPRISYRLTCGDAITLLDASRDLAVRDMWWGGGVPSSAADARVLRLVERLCRDADTFADIGAYSGMFAVIAARANPSIRCYAYEIVPENYQLMLENVLENDLLSQISCRLLGLGGEPGSIRIPKRLGLASNASSLNIGSSFSSGATIPITTLDEQASAWTGRLAMKIDVEGFELEVLSGGRATLDRLRPDIICEVLPETRPATVASLQSLLAERGYAFFQSRDEGFVRSAEIAPCVAGKDWLFSTRDDIEELIGSVG